MWTLGNTAIRNPYALVDTMDVIIVMRQRGVNQYTDIQNLTLWGDVLVERNIVELGDDETYSVGRK